MSIYRFQVLIFWWLWICRRHLGQSALLTIVQDKCITNSSSAIAPIYKMDDKYWQNKEITSFKENISYPFGTTLLCESRNCDYYGVNWQNVHSFMPMPYYDNLITDRRWEDFQTFFTKHVDSKKQPLQYVKVGEINQYNFKVSFSLLAEKEAHVFLCDGLKVFSSRCVWLMIHGWSGARNGFRKCYPLEIQEKYDGKSPTGSCYESTITQEVDGDERLSANKWNHFRIVKDKQDSIHIEDQYGKILVEGSIADFQINLKYLFFHSKSFNALWKLHDFTYTLITEEKSAQVGFNVKQVYSCVSMFVVMCKKCSMKIEFYANRLIYHKNYYRTTIIDTYIHDDPSNENIFKSAVLPHLSELNSNFVSLGATHPVEKWTEKRFCFKPGADYIYMNLETMYRSSQQPFWGISDLRISSDNELRIIRAYNMARWTEACQFLERDTLLSLEPSKIDTLENWKQCNEYQFGENCLSCGTIFEQKECSKATKYCQLVETPDSTELNEKCYCSIGYSGAKCKETCRGYTYGQSCMKNCTNCAMGCYKDILFGNCDTGGCNDNYQGEKCDIPPTDIFAFDKVPQVTCGYGKCMLTITAFEGRGNKARMKYYMFQYKKQSTNMNWTNVPTPRPLAFNTSETVVLDKLTPGTTYEVRAFGFRKEVDYEYAAYVLDRMDSASVTTWKLDWITIRNFKITLNEKEVDTVQLTWEKPTNQPINYIISTKLNKLKACDNLATTQATNTTVDGHQDSWNITGLHPYANYTFKIVPEYFWGEGQLSSIDIETAYQTSIEPNEYPTSEYFDLTHANPILKFALAKCDFLKGPIDVRVDGVGQDQWCNRSAVFKEGSIKDEFRFDNKLEPFCNYKISIEYFRDALRQLTRYVSFATKPTVPKEVTDLNVISKGLDHIALRWKPAYPPTGILKEYQVEIGLNKDGYWKGQFKFVEKKDFPINTCKFWPQYHCIHIHVDKPNLIYQLKIYAKNENTNFALVGTKTAMAVEKVPGKVENLNASWTDENFLLVEWGHPIEANGIIRNFKITANDIEDNYTIQSQDEYHATYNKQVEQTFVLPSPYSIQVSACNSAGCSTEKATKRINDAPPPIPQNSVKQLKRKSNLIEVKFKKTENYDFDRYLYILISECNSCESSIEELINELKVFHKSNNYAKYNTAISHWKLARSKRYFMEENDHMISIGNTSNLMIKDDMTYYLAFVWLYKHNGFIRTNYTIITSSSDESDKGRSSSGAWPFLKQFMFIGFLILLGTIITIICRKFKKQIMESTRRIFNSISRMHTESSVPSEPIYENHCLLEMRRKTRTLRPLSVVITEEIVPGVPTFKTQHSKRVALEEFPDYVKRCLENDELKRQHGLFSNEKIHDFSYGDLPENKPKNRYKNMIAYNHTRVKLNKIDDDPYSDYINANYIDGYRLPRAYIATQGPKSNTLVDFWRMIWQEKVSYIVALANVIEGNKKKLEQYWPNVNEQVTHGDFKITYVSTEVHANYDFRKFELVNKYSKPRVIGQLHFKVWPDHGVPLYPQSLVPLLLKMLQFRSRDFPLVVHCSAGVGRTGTIILCDLCLRMAKDGYLDLFSMLEHLRNQRRNMVDNVEQYKLVHLVILDCLFTLKTSLAVDSKLWNEIDKMDLRSNVKYIRDCEWQDDAMKTVAYLDKNDVPPIVPNKNRFPNILPEPVARVYLHPYPDRDTTYINAVYVDGFCEPSRFIVTQYPLPNTIGDFWRLVAEQEISVIVCLNDPPIGDKSFKLFWPTVKRQTTIKPVDVISVTYLKRQNFQVYSLVTMELATSYEYQENETRKVEMLLLHGWKYPNLVPDKSDFITLVDGASKLSRNSKRVLVTCHDGATASGLFIAMSFLMEKMKLEQELDVCQAVRSIRTSRKQFVNNEEQLKFLYDASLLYAEENFLQYANFNN